MIARIASLLSHHPTRFALSVVLLAAGVAGHAFGAPSPAPWTHTITLRELMQRYVFPEELLSYRIKFPGTFRDTALRLTEGGVPQEFQLA